MTLKLLVGGILLTLGICGCRHTAPGVTPATPDVAPIQQTGGNEVDPETPAAAGEESPSPEEKAQEEIKAEQPTDEPAAPDPEN